MTYLSALWHRWCGSGAWLLALLPGISRAETSGAAATLAAGEPALGLGLTARALGLGGWRLRGARRRLAALGLPAAVSAVNGRVLATNATLRAACGAPESDLCAMLARGFRVDAALVYRLSVGARELGFSFETVRCLADGAPAFLSARLLEPDLIVWTVIPRERMPQRVPDEDAAAYDAAPFAHLRVSEGRVTRSNAVFRERYGEPGNIPDDLARELAGDPRAAPITGDPPANGGRALLRRRDGTPEICNVWTFARTEGGRSFRDVVIFPVGDSGTAPGAQALLDAMPVALIHFDPSGRLLWSNAHARDMVGQDLQPGIELSELVEPLGRPVDALLSDTAPGASSRREMVRLRDGTLDAFLHISLIQVSLDGTPGILAVLSDASELRLLEDKFAQSQKMEAIGQLAGGVAHDFNNVLTAISGHSDLLLLGKDALHPDYSDLMQIRQNTLRAAALVRQLLAFSRKQTLKPELLSVQDVVSDTQYLLNRLIGKKVSLTVEHGSDLWMVKADQQQLEQALMNLVVNARDAMPGGGTVSLATRNLALDEQTIRQDVEIPAGAYVEIGVADSGTGIDPQMLGRIFEPFFTTKARGEGTGLGLSTVYGIVKQSGGFIFAENRAEGGAHFRILLPRASPGSVDAAPAGGHRRVDRRDLTGKGTVLLVEDEDPVRSFASRALRLRGYEVVEAASAEEAMAFLSTPENHVDVLVSDVVMPGMDGPSFAIEARKLRPGLRVVFISGYAEDSFRRNLVHDEFLFLPKPFSLTDLTAKVKEALSQDA
ncbi:MAG TPA: ATP-binding protein [Thermohalobaculum sp.]|nr:ATP-binding protein [Thermohalobaculum sp.]